MTRTRLKATIICTVATLLLLAAGVGVFYNKRAKPLGSVVLGDGRVLHIEGITYGTNHVIGWESPLTERLGPWMPPRLRVLLKGKRPKSEIALDKPGLVLWVNATDAATGKQVDCQGIRLEFLDDAGDAFGTDTSSWFGSSAFWRQGHVFHAYPRGATTLHLRIVPWRKGHASTIPLANPFVAPAKSWPGKPLPQQIQVGNLQILLTHLSKKTNGSPENFWQTPCLYWEPQWELRRQGQVLVDWGQAEWTAEDFDGNRAQHLGVHQPVLRFHGTFYPSATNRDAALVITNSPPVDSDALRTNHLWNLPCSFEGQSLTLMGLFPPGMHVFSRGVYQTNPPAGMRAPLGGSPSGWVSQSRQVTPFHKQTWFGHYTPQSVIYLHAPHSRPAVRVALRLRDDQGRLWLAKPEPEGGQDAIWPFLIESAPEVKTIVAEVVALKPVSATFDVAIP